MLVLSRHRDQSIIIGDNIKIIIVDIRGDKVRLGIEAPSDVPVHRQEVYEAIQRDLKAERDLKEKRDFEKAQKAISLHNESSGFGDGIPVVPAQKEGN